ncbi:hypothetical protein QTN25_000795 [Entamoeba marina]
MSTRRVPNLPGFVISFAIYVGFGEIDITTKDLQKGQYEVGLEVDGMSIVCLTNIHIEPIEYSIQVVEEGIRVCFEKHSKIAFDLCLAQKMSNGSLNYYQSYHVPSGTSVMISRVNEWPKVIECFILRLYHHDNGLFSKKVDLNTPYIHSKQFIIQ